MLCDVCFRMLRRQDGRTWKGTYDLHFQHHSNEDSLHQSADMNCGICRVLAEELKSKRQNATGKTATVKTRSAQLLSASDKAACDGEPNGNVSDRIRSRSSSPGGPRFNVSAMLSVLDHPRVKDLYRLDFRLRCDQIRGRRTFILQKINSSDPPFRTQLSDDTSSDEVHTLVLNWINRCSRECKSHCGNVSDRVPDWYPARLISLKELKAANSFENKIRNRGSETFNASVQLIETKDWVKTGRPSKNNRYVTLSHCWGQVVTDQHKLTSRNIDAMKAGIDLSSLPKTFREAIVFAARLPHVGYIWIDSLCIKQGQEDISDWLEQSASMYKVYSETFLNISATDAPDSQGGLFRYRTPELLLENEVTLNIEGLPGAHPPPPRQPPAQNVVQTTMPLGPSTGRKLIRLLATYWFIQPIFALLHFLHRGLGAFLEVGQNTPFASEAPPSSENAKLANGINAVKRARARVGAAKAFATLTRLDSSLSEDSDVAPSELHDLKRCTILDASFWSERIDNAPVNRRAWVLQERLMSPRVLHFCRDQVAWECCGFDAAEGQPEGMPNFQLTSGGIIEESRLKGLEVKQDGKRLRSIRLQGMRDPDLHMRPRIYALELWRRIVEVYSRTAITNDDDKLIALSGMAKLMAEKIGSKGKPAKYAAGLWEHHLASQLLWQVEPVWREVGRAFDNLSNTPAAYRAPSWSWAAVNADKGHGVVCADITDRDLFIQIEKVAVKPRDKQNIYGIVQEEDTYLDLWGKLRKAILYEKPKGRFGWILLDRGVDQEEHTNVYLDCPADGKKNQIFGKEHGESRVYVIPAAKGPRIASEESKYLTCLLVQHVPDHEGQPVFRRIGITKLSPWADKEALAEILEVMQSDINMPKLDYNPKTGLSKIRLV